MIKIIKLLDRQKDPHRHREQGWQEQTGWLDAHRDTGMKAAPEIRMSLSGCELIAPPQEIPEPAVHPKK